MIVPARARLIPAARRMRAQGAVISVAVLLACLALGAARAQTDSLSPTARFDVLHRELNQSIREKNPKETLEILSRMRELPQGVKGEMLFFEGHAHYQLKNWSSAYRALVAYLNTLGRKGRNYDLAISLFIKTEGALKEARQGDTERRRARRGWTAAEAAYARVAKARDIWKEKAITFGGPQDDTAWAMARRPGGGFLVAGTFHQPEDKKNKRKESRSMGLIALSRDGRMAWNRVILGTAKDGAIRSITALAGGGFLIGGIHRGFQVAARLDKNAVPVPNHDGEPWVSAYARAKDGSVPIVTAAGDGTVLAIGTETVVKNGKSARLAYAFRLAKDGKILGKTLYSGNAQRFWHDITGAATLPGGDIVAVGEARAQEAWDTRNGMGFLLRVTPQGRLVWARRIPAGDKSDVRFAAVVPAGDGGIIAAGRQGRRLLIVKTGADGRPLWRKTMAYRDLFPSAAREICAIPELRQRIKEAQEANTGPIPTADRVAKVHALACGSGTPFLSVSAIAPRKNGYLVLGQQGRGNRKNADIRLIAIDEAGTVLWDRIYGHDGFDLATSALATEDGGMIIAGATDSVGTGGRDFLMFKIDEMGLFAPWTRLGPPSKAKPKRKQAGTKASASMPLTKVQKKPELKEKTVAKPAPRAAAKDKPQPVTGGRGSPPETKGAGAWRDPDGGGTEAVTKPPADQPATPESEAEDSTDTSIGAIFGSIFGGEDEKAPD